MTAESPTTPADPPKWLGSNSVAKAADAALALDWPIAVRRLVHDAITGGVPTVTSDRRAALIRAVLSLPDTEGVASLRASGTPAPSAEVIAAEIEAHAAHAIPRDDLALIRDLASGLSLKEIAAKGAGTRSSVHMRAGRMRQRLGVRSNCQAVHEVMRRGLLKEVPRP